MRLSNSERNKLYVNTLHGRIKELFKGAKHTARQKGYEFSLAENDLKDIWHLQDGKCVFTGLPMSTERGSVYLVSIDRINSKIGYHKSNVQLVCWPANRAKNNMSEKDFLILCAHVVNHLGKKFCPIS